MKPHILVLSCVCMLSTSTCTTPTVTASDNRPPESDLVEVPEVEGGGANYIPVSWEIMTDPWEGEVAGNTFQTQACVYHAFKVDDVLVEWVYCDAVFQYQGQPLACPFLIVPMEDDVQVAIPIYKSGVSLECSDALGGVPFLPPGPPPTPSKTPRTKHHSQSSGVVSL